LGNTEKTLRELRSREESNLPEKVACDILRALTILGGSSWESELSDTLLELWHQDQSQPVDLSRLQTEIEGALKTLNDRGVITSQRRVKADLSAQAQREEMLYSALSYSLLISVFGSDRQVLKYRGQT
jgi:hypothetical protein